MRRLFALALLLLPLAACGGPASDGPETLSDTPSRRASGEATIQGARTRPPETVFAQHRGGP